MSLHSARWMAFLFIVLASPLFAFTQEYNPFEIESRLEQKVLAGTRVAQTPNNPFDVELTKPTGSIILKDKREDALKKEFLSRERKKTNIEFWICFIGIFILSIAISVYRNFIRMSFRALWNRNLLQNLFRDRRYFGFAIYAFYSLFILGVSFVISAWLKDYYLWDFDYILFAKVFFLLALLILAKHGMIWLSSILLTPSTRIKEYNFNIALFNIQLSLVLLPLNLIYTLDYSMFESYLLYIQAVLIILAWIIRSFRSSLLFHKYLPLHFFHFFMYLCTVEIAPILLIRNYFLSNLVN